MPGRTRGNNPLDPFFDYLRGLGGQGAGNLVGRLASAVLPRCCICGAQVYVSAPCIHCGRYACHEHGFFHVSGVSLCAECAEPLDTGAAQRARQAEAPVDEPGAGDYPWNVLACEPTLDPRMINGAFRRKAKEYHPDLIRNNPATAEAFKALVKARDEALAIAASGG